MSYQVYWLGDTRHVVFDDYEEAVEWAQTVTFEESTLNTAVIVERMESRIKRVIIVTWFFDATWTIENIKY
jgi:hypothetical protein